jgi:Mg-chelatase subunit ChlD
VPVYLPVALGERACIPGANHTDVALVLDASTSMNDLTTAGRSKLRAAQDAARRFVSLMDLAGGDQAAVVTFNAEGKLLRPLSSDEAALELAIDGIAPVQLTRIQEGIAIAHAELAGQRHRATNLTAMIVLTDGRNNPEPVAVAEAAAEAAKRAGIRIFTIGLGDDIEAEALGRMATDADGFFRAPDGEDLVRIYEQIALAIPCPPASYWPQP